MNANAVEVKVRKSGGNATGLLIKSGEVVIQTEFAELASCDFPVWTSAPIPVEIPPNGTRDFVAAPGTGGGLTRAPDAEYPHVIKFPIYRGQDLASPQAYRQAPADGAKETVAKVPIVALATALTGRVEGRLIETHCVLPIWSDGAAVLVTLDWCEGEPAEGAPNPEWHMRASAGLPAVMGLEQLMEASRLPSNAEELQCSVRLAPWLLGAQLLGEPGRETSHPIWQHEWRFATRAQLLGALARISSGLRGQPPADYKDAA